jgi:Holliday junction resolvase
MEEELYTLQDLSDMLKIHPRSVAYRMKVLGIEKTSKKGSVIYLDNDECDAILNFKKRVSTSNYDSNFYSRGKIYIIEYFLREKNNSAVDIAKHFNTSEHFVNRVLNEYFENNCQILVRSSI